MAITGIVGVVIGTISQFLISAVNRRAENKRANRTVQATIDNTNKNLRIQYVTDKRVDWIYAVRDEIATFISVDYEIAEKYRVKGDGSVPPEMNAAANKTVAKLRLFLNPKGEKDQALLELITDIQLNLNQESENFDAAQFQTDMEKIDCTCTTVH